MQRLKLKKNSIAIKHSWNSQQYLHTPATSSDRWYSALLAKCNLSAAEVYAASPHPNVNTRHWRGSLISTRESFLRPELLAGGCTRRTEQTELSLGWLVLGEQSCHIGTADSYSAVNNARAIAPETMNRRDTQMPLRSLGFFICWQHARF